LRNDGLLIRLPGSVNPVLLPTVRLNARKSPAPEN